MKPPAGERDDGALAAMALAGEDRAFTQLMGRHKGALYRFVRRYVGDDGEAQDLVQETFLAAWSSLETFDARLPMAAWLRRIALNKCRDWSRRRRVRSFFFRASPIDEARAIPVDQAPTATEDDHRMRQLDAAISSLPRTLKEPLVLTVFESLSQEEAGRLLGISTKAVETRVYRAKQALRRILEV